MSFLYRNMGGDLFYGLLALNCPCFFFLLFKLLCKWCFGCVHFYCALLIHYVLSTVVPP